MKQGFVTFISLLALISCGQQSKAPTAKPKKGHAGLFPVKVKDKWGYIDKTGNLVINPQFDDAWSFSEGLAVVQIGDKLGYIDKTGNLVISPQFAFASAFSEGLAAVMIDFKCG
ncbi:MAG: WG repeat-containing protein [candidate division WOR-3 bacterium]